MHRKAQSRPVPVFGLLVALLLPVATSHFAPLHADDALEGARSANDEDDAETLEYARERLRHGHYREAAAVAAALLEAKNPEPEALELLVRAETARGRIESAHALLKETLADPAQAPLHPMAHLLQAELLWERDPKALERALTKALEEKPSWLRAQALRVRLLVRQGKRKEARAAVLAALEQVRKTAPDRLRAEDHRALAAITEAAELLPELASLHVRPFAEEARRALQTAWDMDPGDPELLCTWAELYLRKWNLPEARRLLKRALEIDPKSARAHALMADVDLEDLYGGGEKYDRIREHIALALATDPGHPRALTLEGELLLTDGLFAEALAAFEQTLERAPRNTRALAGTIAAKRLAGDEEHAKSLERTILERLAAPERAELLRRLATLLDARFRYREAFDTARAAIEADPSYPPAWGRLGLAAMRIGDLEQARTFLEKANAADPYDLFVYNVLELLDLLDKHFIRFETEHFVIRMHKDEEPWLRPYLEPFCERAWKTLSARWGVELDTKIHLEVYPNLQDFSVRAVGHRFIPASGVTFWRTVALASPAAFPPGAHGWAQVLWHELAHVATLERSNYRVPRWLTEGISVFEESLGDRRWARDWDDMLLDAISRGRIMGILELNEGFSKPRFPGQVMLGYYQGGMICHYLAETRGFEAILALLDGYREGKRLADMCREELGLEPEAFDRAFLAWLRAKLGVERYRARIDSVAELARLRRAARKAPRNAEPLARYGLGCCDLGRWADAEIVAGKLLALDPTNADAKLIDARTASHRGEYEHALELFAEALALGTSDPIGAHLGRARIFEKLAARKGKQPARALEELERALRLAPRSRALLSRVYNLAKALEDDKRVEALEPRLAALSPNHVKLWFRLGERAEKAADVQQALYYYEQILYVEPRYAPVHAALAKLYARTGRTSQEIERELALLAVTDKKNELLEVTKREVEALLRKTPSGDEGSPTHPNRARPEAPSASARPRGSF